MTAPTVRAGTKPVTLPQALVEAVLLQVAAALPGSDIAADLDELGVYVRMADADQVEARWLGTAHINAHIHSLTAGILDQLGTVTIERSDAQPAARKLAGACDLVVSG